MSGDSIRHIDEALSYALSVFKERVGEAVSVENLPQSRNFLFKLTAQDGKEYVVKIYSERRDLIPNIEWTAYEKLKGKQSVRQCFAMENGNGQKAYAILEYVRGNTLLEALDLLQKQPSIETMVVKQIVSFISECATIKLHGFGEIGTDFSGKFSTWIDFLDNFLARLESAVKALPENALSSRMQRLFGCLAGFRFAECKFLASREAAFVPIDLNMSNFLLAQENRMVALDLENFWAADPLFALGEWAAHTFGTSRFDAFLAAYRPLSTTEMASVRFYALMSNLNVLMYVINHQVTDPEQAAPWGNPNRFVDLMASHGDWLVSQYG